MRSDLQLGAPPAHFSAASTSGTLRTMAGKTKITPRLPDKIVRDCVERGLGHAAVVREVRSRTGHEFTPRAVAKWRERNGFPAIGQPRYRGLIPWRVSVDHDGLYVHYMLRLEARRRGGEQLPPVPERRLKTFLEELEKLDAVIHYDRATERGFWRVARRYDENGVPIDTDIVENLEVPR